MFPLPIRHWLLAQQKRIAAVSIYVYGKRGVMYWQVMVLFSDTTAVARRFMWAALVQEGIHGQERIYND